MRKPIVVTVAAGTALTVALAGCGAKEMPENPPDAPTANPPAPELAPEPEPLGNPPPPEPDADLGAVIPPSWDDVKSGHPEGATNPPIPVLIVTPDRDCYKGWRSPMVPPTPQNQDRVQACPTPEDCGTQVQCPPKADELLAAWKAGTEPGPK